MLTRSNPNYGYKLFLTIQKLWSSFVVNAIFISVHSITFEEEKLFEMYRKKLYLILICALLLGISCARQSRKAGRILKEAETIVEQHPDSALFLLDPVRHPQNLGEKQRCHYLLLQVQAKDKSCREITSDTLIFNVKDYYIKNRDLRRAALSAYYCGRVLYEQKRYEKALQAYLDAENLSKQKNNDNNLKGLIRSSIGDVYYKQLLEDEAVSRYKQANRYFHQAENHRNEIITFNLTGNCFLMQEERDSAFIYYLKGLALADQYFPVDSPEQARLYCNLANVFKEEGQNDSARYYIEQSLARLPEGKDSYLTANIYKIWSKIDAEDENYRAALDHHKLYSKYLSSILDENKSRAVLEVQKKYDFQLIQNRNAQLLIDRQRIFLIALCLFLVIVVSFFFFYRRSMERKKEMLEAEQKIYRLKELARGFNEKENIFRNILLRHFGILKKVALLEGYLKDDEKKQGQHLLKKFNEIVYGQEELDWDLLYRTMNDLSDGFFERLRKAFPQLDESEFRICCLSYAELTNTEIGIMLKYSTNTIQTKKTSIRKKLGIKTFGNIHDFLDEKVKN
ncbi:MAG: hypothetical protein AB7D05_00395 [Mangrovibacterium sp.]